jgi:putative ATPase
VERIGMPEGRIPLAQAVTFLACAPKSNAAYVGIDRALEAVSATGSLPVPMHLRNAPTGLMKHLGYGDGYEYPHDAPDGFVATPNLPQELGAPSPSGWPPCGVGGPGETIQRAERRVGGAAANPGHSARRRSGYCPTPCPFRRRDAVEWPRAPWKDIAGCV